MCVLKFGGASVADLEGIARAAEIIVETADLFSKGIVVVVSAMGDETDRLLQMARQVNPHPAEREMDMLVSTGEQKSCALLALAVMARGREAISFTGGQAGIITDDEYMEAKILDVRPCFVEEALGQGKIAIVAGFQGVTYAGDITTLGRGGSDTTAVALAAALHRKEVRFYKDVGGVFAADPKKEKNARLLPRLSYEEALDLVVQGAKILHDRSILLAQRNGVKLVVRSFRDSSLRGTVIEGNIVGNAQLYYEEELKYVGTTARI